MSAIPARDDIFNSLNDAATIQLNLGLLYDFITQRIGDGTGTATEKAAARAALETPRGMQPITAAVGSNALTVTLNPTNLEFRHATLGNGTVNMRTVAAAISLVISSGSTLGTVSAVASRVALLAIDNAGTVELAAVNANGGFHFDESQLITTTAEGGAGAADSAAVVYSTTARSNVPFRFVGYVDSTQGTAGTWTTAPSKIQGGGGLLLALLKSQQISNSATVATTSGTAFDFTGIPSYAKRVTLNFAGVSANAGVTVRVRLGTASGVETTSYTASYATLPNAGATTSSTLTDGFAIPLVDGASVVHGSIVFTNMGDNRWTAQGVGAFTNGGAMFVAAGSKALAGVLDRVRVDTVSATAFDAGLMSIAWE